MVEFNVENENLLKTEFNALLARSGVSVTIDHWSAVFCGYKNLKRMSERVRDEIDNPKWLK